MIPSTAIPRRGAHIRRTSISANDAGADGRLKELEAWLASLDLPGGGVLSPASVDASFRRYFRWQLGDESYIVMDAPPDREDCMPFLRVAMNLESIGINAPRIIDANPGQGFLLLTDLGDEQYLDRLESAPAEADALYEDALGALARLQRRGVPFQAKLPPYDTKLLEFELSLFHDWLVGVHSEYDLTAGEESAWRECCSLLVRNALDQPQVFVHRDYHSRNLMVVDDANPGVLDFQDAVEGPYTYDVVSLLKDCYVRWEPERVLEWAERFRMLVADVPGLDVDAGTFRRSFELMGVQRHLKAAGIFARLNHRDGKSRYLEDIPRTLSYVTELEDRYPELSFVIELIRVRVLPRFGEPAGGKA